MGAAVPGLLTGTSGAVLVARRLEWLLRDPLWLGALVCLPDRRLVHEGNGGVCVIEILVRLFSCGLRLPFTCGYGGV